MPCLLKGKQALYYIMCFSYRLFTPQVAQGSKYEDGIVAQLSICNTAYGGKGIASEN